MSKKAAESLLQPQQTHEEKEFDDDLNAFLGEDDNAPSTEDREMKKLRSQEDSLQRAKSQPETSNKQDV